MVLMFSLAGLPPTAGFYAKLAVLSSAVQAGQLWLAVAAVILSLVGAFYYLRIVKLMYFDEPREAGPVPGHREMRVLLSVNALVLLVLGILPQGLMQLCLHRHQHPLIERSYRALHCGRARLRRRAPQSAPRRGAPS